MNQLDQIQSDQREINEKLDRLLNALWGQSIEEAFTLDEIERRTGYSRRVLEAEIREGRLGYEKRGTSVRVRLGDLNRWRDSLYVPAKANMKVA